MATKKSTSNLSVETFKHEEATRKNILTAEYQSVMRQNEQNPIRIDYERRNRDLDSQLITPGIVEQYLTAIIIKVSPVQLAAPRTFNAEA
jgi:adenine-specific DNA-methyltransferase